jgi:hypothetical protein
VVRVGGGWIHKRSNIKIGRVDDVIQRLAPIGRTEVALITGNSRHDSSKNVGMMKTRVKDMFASQAIVQANSTQLKAGEVGQMNRINRRTMEGGTNGIVEHQTGRCQRRKRERSRGRLAERQRRTKRGVEFAAASTSLMVPVVQLLCEEEVSNR